MARPARMDLDHNATTRLTEAARAAMRALLGDREGDGGREAGGLGGAHGPASGGSAAAESYGNPSSVHALGRSAREQVERARGDVAALVGAAASDVVFTSGGTESDWMAVLGGARAARAAGRPARVVLSPLEHPAVKGAAAALAREGFEVREVPVDAAGRINPNDVSRALEGGAALASFALANHELGNVYEVALLAERARSAGAVVHCDAVQAAGKLAVEVSELGVDP